MNIAYTKTAWALVDDNTNRVYAIKMLVTDQYSAALGYFLAPLYVKKYEDEMCKRIHFFNQNQVWETNKGNKAY